jgi:hypothetical protein
MRLLIPLVLVACGSSSQRTIYNISTVVSALFRDAKLPDLIAQSLGILDERQIATSASSGRSSTRIPRRRRGTRPCAWCCERLRG